MPTYTLSEIMSQATAGIGQRADIPLSVASFYANVAYMEVKNAAPPRFSEMTAYSSTTSGGSRITLPSDFEEMISIQLTTWSSRTTPSATRSYTTLTRVSPENFDANFSDAVGTPNGYFFFNSDLFLSPSPDSVYSVGMRYRSMFTDMSIGTQIPSLETPWRHAVLLRTKALLREYIQDPQGYMLDQQSYLNYVTQLKTDEARRQSSGRLYVTPI